MKSKFKVGDEVIVIKDSDYNFAGSVDANLYHIGDVGIVTENELNGTAVPVVFISFTKKKDNTKLGLIRGDKRGWFALENQITLNTKSARILFSSLEVN